ncbi:MAG: MerR family transcriptional regulator [Candidatus Krumholzibacteriia bacterium]
MPDAHMKVGDLAKQTGVSVRTLHYYDEIGLLKPSHHTQAGYRLYAEEDIARLQQIMSLRQLGFSLGEIRGCLDRPGASPLRMIELHIASLEEQIELQRELRDRLQAIAGALRATGKASAREFIRTIEVMNRMERYFTAEQLEGLKNRRLELGEERIRQAEADWKELLEQVRAEMGKGTDPASEPVTRLARRYRQLIQEFTGGNPEIEASLRAMYQQEPNIASRFGYTHDPEMSAYLCKALAAVRDTCRIENGDEQENRDEQVEQGRRIAGSDLDGGHGRKRGERTDE